MAFAVAAAVLAAASSVVVAQTAPTTREAAACTGLHAAAWHGDAAAVARASRAELQAVDANGRRPLHVAAFARRHAVIRALAAAGADLGALDQDGYDAVMIAAVADDEATLALLLELGADLVDPADPDSRTAQLPLLSRGFGNCCAAPLSRASRIPVSEAFTTCVLCASTPSEKRLKSNGIRLAARKLLGLVEAAP